MAEIRELPSAKFLHECFRYDEETGDLHWKERPLHHFYSEPYQRKFTTLFKDEIAGVSNSEKQYKRVHINGRAMSCHRIIWKMVTGEDPEYVDHIDGDRSNNRFNNLRNVSFRDNSLNQAKSTRNTSGHVGVVWEKEREVWRVSISHDKKELRLGRYKDLEEAIKVRKEAEVEYGYHPNHGKRTLNIN